MDHHESAAANIAGARIAHGERKADRDGGVDRVAAALNNIGADAGGLLFLRHNHTAMRDNALHMENSFAAALVGARGEWQREHCGQCHANKASQCK